MVADASPGAESSDEAVLHINQADGSVSLRLSESIVNRSGLLRQFSASAADGVTPLPISLSSFVQWLQASLPAASEASSKAEMLRISSFLVDQATEASIASELGLQLEAAILSCNESSAVVKTLNDLNFELACIVLGKCPCTLTQLLAQLPAALHPAAVYGKTVDGHLCMDAQFCCSSAVAESTIAFLMASVPANLRSLSLPHNRIRPDAAAVLARHITSLTALTALDLSHNSIKEEGMNHLAPTLPALSYLASLRLSHNLLGAPGIQALADFLTHLMLLTALDVGTNNMQAEGTLMLANCLFALTELRELELGGNALHDLGADVLAQELPHASALTRLGLSFNGLNITAIQSLRTPLASLTALEDLDLSLNPFALAGVLLLGSVLSSLTRLTRLSLNGVHRLSEVDHLLEDENAGIWHDFIRTMAAEAVGGDLEAPRGGTASLRSLRINKTGTLLHLMRFSNMNVGVASFSSVQQLLAKSAAHLPSLDAFSNLVELDLSGATFQVTLLQPLTALTYLNLQQSLFEYPGDNDDGDEDDVLPAHVDTLLYHIPNPQQLAHLSLRSARRMRDLSNQNRASLFSTLCSLTHLDLTGCKLKPRHAAPLASAVGMLRQLEVLCIGGNDFGGGDCVALATALTGLPRLRTLLMDCVHLKETGVMEVLPCIRELTALQTLCWGRAGDGLLRGIGAHLEAMSSLTRVELDHNALGRLDTPDLSWLQHVPCLRALNLKSNALFAHGAKAVAEQLGRATGLRALNLSHNSLGVEGAVALQEPLRRLLLLTQLKLRHNNLGKAGVARLAPVLRRLLHLQVLDLGYTSMGTGGAAVLVGEVQHIPGLVQLQIDGNHICSLGVPGSEAECVQTALGLCDCHDCDGQDAAGNTRQHAVATIRSRQSETFTF